MRNAGKTVCRQFIPPPVFTRSLTDQRRAEPSTVTHPPILTHASVPGTLTKPGPKAPHALTCAACDFAAFDGGDHLVGGAGSDNVCATAPEAGTANSKAAAIA